MHKNLYYITGHFHVKIALREYPEFTSGDRRFLGGPHFFTNDQGAKKNVHPSEGDWDFFTSYMIDIFPKKAQKHFFCMF